MMHRTSASALLAAALLLGGSSADAAARAGKIPVNTSATVTASCSVGSAIGNSPQMQSVPIGPLTWNYHGLTLTPSAPIVQDIALTCSRGDAATVTLPAAPAGGFSAASTKNGHSMPFVLWVAASVPASCAAPPPTAQLTLTATSSTQPLHFYVAACAQPKQTQENSGDYTAALSGTLRY